MFGIGTPELFLILIIALVVVGPQRLPELGRTIGRALREFRKVQDEVRGMVQTSIGDDFDDVRKELRGTANEVRRTSNEITGDVKHAADVRSLLPSKKGGPHRTRPTEPTPPSPPDAETATDGPAFGAPADAMSKETPAPDADPSSSERAG